MNFPTTSTWTAKNNRSRKGAAAAGTQPGVFSYNDTMRCVDLKPRIAHPLFLAGLGISAGDLEQFFYGVPAIFKISFAFPVAAAPLAVAVLVFTVLAWKKKFWTGCSRIHYTLVCPAALAFLWLLNYWNLLGWKL